jgi:NAD(P)-dependent dehydrogenase (short-subunit alcohol dehydrogenase family)
VTGAGRGIGREHALLLAAQGARVVVNDLGGSMDGTGSDTGPAHDVVDEITTQGGQAVANTDDVSDFAGAEKLIGTAIEAFGRLDVLVNNAGILRDRMLVNMSEAEWDAVIRVHLKGHAAPARHAMAWWRERSKAGHRVKASVIHTTSLAGLVGNFGQANYAAAKLGVVGLSRTVAIEGRKYGVRSNAVSPSARTRIETSLKPPPPGTFDVFDPANVSPLIAWLALADCPATGQVFQAYGNRVEVIQPSAVAVDVRTDGQWSVAALDRALRGRLPRLPELGDFVEGLVPSQG